MKHLFLLVPNNSGSTLMHDLIARSPAVARLPNEGQFVEGWAGPSPQRLRVVHVFSLSDRFADEDAYDWPAISEAFDRHWTADNPNATVRLEKSPPNVVRAHMLVEHFPDTHFLISWRNPYAAAEGILRNNPRKSPVQAATHMINMLTMAGENIARFGDRSVAASYEDFTADPGAVLDRLAALVPELGPITVDPGQPIRVKGSAYPRIANTNDEQIANLTSGQISEMNTVFLAHRDLLESLGYDMVDPSSAPGSRSVAEAERPSARPGRAPNRPKRLLKGDFNMRRIGTYDVSALRRIAASFGDEWSEMRYRQTTYRVHERTQTIPILWNDPPNLNLIRRADEIEVNQAELFAPVIEDLRTICREHYGPGHFLRMILAQLPAGAEIPPHRDSGASFRVSHRVHLPVITNDGVIFEVGGERLHLEAGQIWEINNFRRHRVHNSSDCDRVHVIFDWYCPSGPLGRNLPADRLVPVG